MGWVVVPVGMEQEAIIFMINQLLSMGDRLEIAI